MSQNGAELLQSAAPWSCSKGNAAQPAAAAFKPRIHARRYSGRGSRPLLSDLKFPEPIQWLTSDTVLGLQNLRPGVAVLGTFRPHSYASVSARDSTASAKGEPQ